MQTKEQLDDLDDGIYQPPRRRSRRCHTYLDNDSHGVSLYPELSPRGRATYPLSLAAAVVRALPGDLDRLAAVPRVDGGFGKRSVPTGVGRPNYTGLAGFPPSEKVMYGWRKVMIDEIRRRQAEGINAGAAVEKVELMRRRGRLSLHQPHHLLNRRKRSAQQLPYFKPNSIPSARVLADAPTTSFGGGPRPEARRVYQWLSQRFGVSPE